MLSLINKSSRRLEMALALAAAVAVIIAFPGFTPPAGAQTPGVYTNNTAKSSARQADGSTGPAGPIAAVTPVQEGFESGPLNTFSSVVPFCGTGGCGWRAVTGTLRSGLYSAFAPD